MFSYCNIFSIEEIEIWSQCGVSWHLYQRVGHWVWVGVLPRYSAGRCSCSGSRSRWRSYSVSLSLSRSSLYCDTSRRRLFAWRWSVNSSSRSCTSGTTYSCTSISSHQSNTRPFTPVTYGWIHPFTYVGHIYCTVLYTRHCTPIIDIY